MIFPHSICESYLQEAYLYKSNIGAYLMGSREKVSAEKAVAVNCAAVDEFYIKSLDSDSLEIPKYFPIVIAAGQQRSLNGPTVLKGMLLIEEIRGKLKSVINFDPFLNEMIHGGLASVITYGTLMGASEEQLENAQGMLIHSLPLKELNTPISISKIAEISIMCVVRSMLDIKGPKDVFNSTFLQNFPIELELPLTGKNFFINQFNFKLGIYDFIYSTAIEAILSIIRREPSLLQNMSSIENIELTLSTKVYNKIQEFQSLIKTEKDLNIFYNAFHSLPFTIGIVLSKCFEFRNNVKITKSIEQILQNIMLTHYNFIEYYLTDPLTLNIMKAVNIKCDGEIYNNDNLFPASAKIITKSRTFESSVVKKPFGQEVKQKVFVKDMMFEKFHHLSKYLVQIPQLYLKKLDKIDTAEANEIEFIYNYQRFNKNG